MIEEGTAVKIFGFPERIDEGTVTGVMRKDGWLFIQIAFVNQVRPEERYICITHPELDIASASRLSCKHNHVAELHIDGYVYYSPEWCCPTPRFFTLPFIDQVDSMLQHVKRSTAGLGVDDCP